MILSCQKCGITVPLLRALTKSRSNRIDALQKQIHWIERYRRGNNTIKDDDLKQLKVELAELLEEASKIDKLRRLPLYSCRITGWKFVCSRCHDKALTLFFEHLQGFTCLLLGGPGLLALV